MNIDFYYSPRERCVESVSVEISEQTLLGEAIPENLATDLDPQSLTYAVWGRAVGLDYPLQKGDRVEVLRELRVDPMTARRERFNQQGVKKAGLFKTKRAGSKAGY